MPFAQSRDVLAFQGPPSLERTTRPGPWLGKGMVDGGEGTQAQDWRDVLDYYCLACWRSTTLAVVMRFLSPHMPKPA